MAAADAVADLPGWDIFQGPGAQADVMPTGDVVGHTPGDSCLCGPLTIPVEHHSGAVGWVYVHASLDGRELLEVFGG